MIDFEFAQHTLTHTHSHTHTHPPTHPHTLSFFLSLSLSLSLSTPPPPATHTCATDQALQQNLEHRRALSLSPPLSLSLKT